MLPPCAPDNPAVQKPPVVLFVSHACQWCAALCEHLQEHDDLIVLVAESASQVFSCLRERALDMVVLDMSLQGQRALELYHQIRTASALPVLALVSGRDGMGEAEVLDLGADDCIEGLASPGVFMARVRALLRRRTGAVGRRRVCGDLVINAATRAVHLGPRPIHLGGAEFDLLWLLCAHAGQILSREVIFSKVRGIPYDGRDRSIDVRIARLRARIGDDARQPRWIRTVRSRGYMLTDGSRHE